MKKKFYVKRLTMFLKQVIIYNVNGIKRLTIDIATTLF